MECQGQKGKGRGILNISRIFRLKESNVKNNSYIMCLKKNNSTQFDPNWIMTEYSK